MTIEAAVETIDPVSARDLLTNHNPKNRKVSTTTVALYTRQMKEGRWVLNGEGIMFDTKGDLLNGQHRLLACVESGVAFQTLVVRGLPSETIDSMDQHRKRSAGDVLGMHGYHNGTHLASTARVIHRWDAGIRSASLVGAGHLMLSPAELMDVIEKEPFLVPACEASRKKESERLASPRVYGSLWVLAHRASEPVADEFFSRLNSGEMLEKGNPILTYRRYLLMSHSQSNARRVYQTTSYTMLHAGVRAWNAWVEGRTLATISWKSHAIPEVSIPKEKAAPETV